MPIDPALVVELVAKDFGLTTAQVLGRRRLGHYIHARFAAALLLREQVGLSFPEIGEALGGRDHSTAHNAVQRAYGRRLDRFKYAARLERLADQIHERSTP